MKPILNESDCLRDMLEQEKLLTQQYAVFLTESGNQKLRKLMKENLIASADAQFVVYKETLDRKYSKNSTALTKDVDSVLSAFAKEQREMEKDIHSRQKQ
jgi:coat F domain